MPGCTEGAMAGFWGAKRRGQVWLVALMVAGYFAGWVALMWGVLLLAYRIAGA